MTNRSGYTLMELVVGMTAATLLMGGLASTLFMANNVFDAQIDTLQAARAAAVQAEVARDLGRATAFAGRSADSVTLTVPDEDGDSVAERLTYSYDPAAGTLRLARNGSAPSVLLSGVRASSFAYTMRDVAGSATAPMPYDTNKWGTRWSAGAVYEGYASVTANGVTSLTVPTPAGTADGDLLIAALAWDRKPVGSASGAGWNEVSRIGDLGDNVQLGVWWKLAAPSEPVGHGFTFSYGAQACGWIMRFTGHNPAAPINAFAAERGPATSSSPTSPAVDATTDDTLILRIGAFDGSQVTVGSPGLSGHTPIIMDRTGAHGPQVSGGAGYTHQADAGKSGVSAFALTGSEEWATVTLAIAPE